MMKGLAQQEPISFNPVEEHLPAKPDQPAIKKPLAPIVDCSS
jgi:hypothetical protein